VASDVFTTNATARDKLAGADNVIAVAAHVDTVEGKQQSLGKRRRDLGRDGDANQDEHMGARTIENHAIADDKRKAFISSRLRPENRTQPIMLTNVPLSAANDALVGSGTAVGAEAQTVRARLLLCFVVPVVVCVWC